MYYVYIRYGTGILSGVCRIILEARTRFVFCKALGCRFGVKNLAVCRPVICRIVLSLGSTVLSLRLIYKPTTLGKAR